MFVRGLPTNLRATAGDNLRAQQVRQRMAAFYEGLHSYRQVYCPTCHELWPTDRTLPQGTPETNGTPEIECQR